MHIEHALTLKHLTSHVMLTLSCTFSCSQPFHLYLRHNAYVTTITRLTCNHYCISFFLPQCHVVEGSRDLSRIISLMLDGARFLCSLFSFLSSLSFLSLFHGVIPPVVLFSVCRVLVRLTSRCDSYISGPSSHVVGIDLSPLRMKVDIIM
jgi:hypothetical protein